jgi:hypothetical protein
MGNHHEHPLFSCFAGFVRVVKHKVFPEGDGSPVFHGSKSEVRNGDEIELGKRILDPIVLLAKGQSLAQELRLPPAPLPGTAAARIRPLRDLVN